MGRILIITVAAAMAAGLGTASLTPLRATAQTGMAGASALPAPDEFSRRVREAVRLDYQLQKDFTYREHRRDIKISRLGKVTIGPLRTFEVYPGDRSGGTYKRLVAVNGDPLTAAELAARDAEHERDIRLAAERARTESPPQRMEREQKTGEEQRDRDAMLADALAVYTPTLVGRETIDGQPVIVADVSPRADARPTTREGRWMKQFAGRIWVAEADHQIVKLDMRATDDVTIAWGVVGRVHRGSRVMVRRTWFDRVWLPAETTYQASGRTLLFRTFQFSVTTTYSDYRRRQSEGR
jgi:hypothetical protein